MTTAVSTKSKAPGRPRTPRDIADARALNRIAALAFQILSSLRQHGHRQYDSERTLRQWLSDVQFTIADLAPALALLEATGRIGRGPENKNSPRAGWLAGGAERPVWSSTAAVPESASEDADEELLGVNAPRPGSLVNVAEKPAEAVAAPLSSPLRHQQMH